MKKILLLLPLLFSLTFCTGDYPLKVYHLKCEGLTNPLGIDNTEPHFSWKMLSGTPQVQQYYEIEVASDPSLLEDGRADLWMSGKVESSSGIMIPYQGAPLYSGQSCWWKVRIHTDKGETAESQIQKFSIGKLSGDDFTGRFIGSDLGQAQSLILWKSFTYPGQGRAILHVNSLGYHEVYVNGKSISDAVLSPAVSQLDKRSLTKTYDITPFISEGENTIAFWIGSGWYKKKTFQAEHDGPAVRADLEIQDGNVPNTLLYTDATWHGCPGGYQDTGEWRSWHFEGEIIDARQIPPTLTDDVLKDFPGCPVKEISVSGIEATPQMCQNTVIKETVTPVSVTDAEDNSWLVDFGKVLNGMIEFRCRMESGDTVTARYADHLNGEGELDGCVTEDTFICSGDTASDIFRNKFNHHCFRYLVLSGLPYEPSVEDISAHRIGMDGALTGTFESSDEDLNAIHNMLCYTMDNLTYCGYMVDCAHIEQLGYGGDGNASTLSLQNNFDVAPVYMNWMQAWNDVIRPDGGLPHTAPCPYRAGGGPYWCSFIVQAPWRTWMNYGDDRLLHRCYPQMRHWLEYVDTYTVEGLLDVWPNTDYRHWYLGDWLAPEGVEVTDPVSVRLISNCVLVQSYNELIQIAAHLGYPDHVKEYENRRDSLSRRINEAFYDSTSHIYGRGTQLDMAYPLLTGVVAAEDVPAVSEKFLERTKTEYGDHIAAGLTGIPVISEWATLSHQADFIYRMLKKEDYPGYLYMIRNGGTSTWEDWDNPRSYLHNCFNGMDSWFFQALGGIIPLSPGYEQILIDPQVPEGLESVKVTREIPQGTVTVEWHRTGRGYAGFTVTLPPNVSPVIKGSKVRRVRNSNTYTGRIDLPSQTSSTDEPR